MTEQLRACPECEVNTLLDVCPNCDYEFVKQKEEAKGKKK